MFKMRSIFEYNDYREFLKDYYTNMKAEKKSFSFRVFARLADCGSPSTLKRVMAGERNLTPNMIEKFSKALKLTKVEHEFFSNLVQLNQSKNPLEKRSVAERLARSRRYRELYPLSSVQMNYYKNWFYIPVRELVGLKGFREDPIWIAKNADPAITPQEAEKALEELQKLGLIARGPNGKLQLSSKTVTTGDEVSSLFLTEFHKEMTKKSMESIERHSREKRDISSVTVGISSKSFEKIKEKIQNFRKEILEIAANEEDPNVVYQLNMQMFPLSKETKEGE